MRATDIVRRRQAGARRGEGRGRRLLRAIALAALLVLLAAALVPIAGAAAGAAGLLALTSDLPDVPSLRQLAADYRPSTATTRLYAREGPDGDLILIDEIGDPRRVAGWVRPAGLPPHVAAAYLAATGQPSEPAARPSLAEVALEWWRAGTLSDTPSPLAAHLVRTQLRDGDASTDARHTFQDWLLGRRIDTHFTVEQQVEWALNTDYYGNLAYGIEAAARVYFDKSAADLTPGEAAALAAAARNPAANPFDDPTAAETARAAVLAVMTARGDLSAAAVTEASATPLALAPPPGSASPVPAFARLARHELEQRFGPERLLAGNLDVETTLDPALQTQVECAMPADDATSPSGGGPPCPAGEHLPAGAALGDGDAPRASVVALHPATGEIAALTGEVETPRPMGTLARPFIYLTALSQGYTAATLLMDVETSNLQADNSNPPRQPDDRLLGPLRLREAAAAGRAAPAAEVLGWVGNERVLATALALGLRPTEAAAGPALVDAGFAATLLDLGSAFATIGNGGAAAGAASGDDLPRPTTLRRVTDSDGETLYSRQTITRETLAPELAYLMTDILADAAARCRATACPDELELPDGRPAAFATGAAGDDDWAIGYTPELLVGVRTAGGEASPLWRALMAWATTDAPKSEWPRPPGLQRVAVCTISGQLPAPEVDCPTVREWFIPGTEPTAVDTMTREVAVNRETGRLATIFTPPQLIERRTYINYPPEAATWAAEAGTEPIPTEYDTIRHVPARSGGAAIESPGPWSEISGQWPVVGSAGGEGFAYYRLTYFPGLLPEAMQTIVARGETPVDAAELGVWDTTLLDDGLYTLLLTVVRQDGTFDEVAIPVTVENE